MLVLNFILLFMLFSHPQEKQQVWRPLDVNKQSLSALSAFTISVNKNVYFAKEPVVITMAIQNNSAISLMGSFNPNFESGNLIVHYGKLNTPGETLKTYSCIRKERPPHILLLPQEVKPQEQTFQKEILLFDTKTKSFVLDKPGIYQFNAVYQEVPNDLASQLISNTVTVEVLPVPEDEYQQLKLYHDENVAKLIQNDKVDLTSTELEIILGKLKETILQRPNSVYAKHFKDGLMRGLRIKIFSNEATEEEKILYQKYLSAEQSQNNLQ